MTSLKPTIPPLVKNEGGQVSRQIFTDPALYRVELDQVFGRAWLFLAHDTQLPKPGDFLNTFMGEDPILVIRQNDGSIKAFLNACTHRGPLLCQAEEGRAKTFQCTYHGWVFGIDGGLIDVRPEGEAAYGARKEAFGLKPIRIESYKGLWFGNFDDSVPALVDFLGDFTWYLDTIFDPLPTGVEFVGGTMRQRLKCNWKLAAENIVADTYHVFAAHAVAAGVNMSRATMRLPVGIEPGGPPGISATVSGHGWNAHSDGYGSYALFRDPKQWMAYVDRQRPRYIERLGAERAQFIGSSIDGGVFPNFLFVPGFTYRQIHPKGPDECEIWMWTVVDKELPDELKQEMVRFNARMLGTSGMFEMDDCANMERITTTLHGTLGRHQYSDYTMGQGLEARHEIYPGLVEKRISDNGFRGYYRRWAEYMQANSAKDIPPTENLRHKERSHG